MADDETNEESTLHHKLEGAASGAIMGTMIHLTLGALQLDWGKNAGYQNHCDLFQKEDLGMVPDYAYDEPIIMEGYSRKLGQTLGRLELLGYTMSKVRQEYAIKESAWGDPYQRHLSFKKFCELIGGVNVAEVTGKWSEANHDQKFIPKDVVKKFGYNQYRDDGPVPDYWAIETLLEGLSPYAKLRLLAENPNNLSLPIIWPFGALIESGWASKEDFQSELSKDQKILIVTEGSSDAKILQKALVLLKKEYSEFFRFIDMEEGYPFSGTGNLFKFTQGLVSIGISNQIVILYDNDAEGISKFEATKKLTLPKNMAVTILPDIKALKKFTTIGPNGIRKENINGKAASIECYLDLDYEMRGETPRIRWSSYNEPLDRYQGALENKTAYMKKFLNLKNTSSGYNFENISIVLDSIYKACLKIVGGP